MEKKRYLVAIRRKAGDGQVNVLVLAPSAKAITELSPKGWPELEVLETVPDAFTPGRMDDLAKAHVFDLDSPSDVAWLSRPY